MRRAPRDLPFPAFTTQILLLSPGDKQQKPTQRFDHPRENQIEDVLSPFPPGTDRN